MRHARSRTQHRPTQWVVSTNSWGARTVVSGAGVTAFNLVETTPSSTTETFQSVDRLTVMRIKGDILFDVETATSGGLVFCSVGVYTGDVLQGTADTWDPTDSRDAHKSWMYLKHFVIATDDTGFAGPSAGAGIGGAGAEQQLPGGTHIDIKVKRILRPQQILRLVAKSFSAQGAALTVNLTPMMRTLLSRAI